MKDRVIILTEHDLFNYNEGEKINLSSHFKLPLDAINEATLIIYHNTETKEKIIFKVRWENWRKPKLTDQ